MADEELNVGVGVTEKSGSQAIIDALKAKVEEFRKELEVFAQTESTTAAGMTRLADGFRELDQAVTVASGSVAATAAPWIESRMNVLAHMQAIQMDESATYHLGETYTASRAVILQHAEALRMNESIYTSNRSVVLQHATALAMDESAYVSNRSIVLQHAEALQLNESVYNADRRVILQHAEALEMDKSVYDVNRKVVLDHAKALELTGNRYQDDRRIVGQHAEALREDESVYVSNRNVVLAHGRALLQNESIYTANRAVVLQHAEALVLDAQSVNQATGEIDKIPTSARRGANAISTLVFGLTAGGVSARTMAIGLGSATSAMASFAETEAVAASASGIGALITVLAVAIGLFYELDVAEKKATATLGDLVGFSSTQLKAFLKANEVDLKAALDQVVLYADKESRILGTGTTDIYYNYKARKAKENFENLTKLREELTKKLIEMEASEARELENESRKEQEKAAEATVDNLRGPAEARKRAAQDELAEQLLDLKRRNAQGADADRLRAAFHQQYSQRIIAIDRETGEARKQLFERLRLTEINEAAKSEKDVFLVRRNAIERSAEQEREAIRKNRDLKPEARKSALEIIERTTTEALTNIEKDRADEILKIREEAQGKLDLLQDTGVNEAKIRESYKRQIELLQAAIESTTVDPLTKAAAKKGLAIIQALIPEEIAKASFDKLIKDNAAYLSSQETGLKRIESLRKAGVITEEEARKRTIAGLIAERDAVASMLPTLQQIAQNLPGNTEAQAEVDQYKTKLLDLAIQIAEVSDRFRELRQAGIAATQDAIVTLLQSVPKVLVQSQATYAIDQMKVHLASANAELQDFMKGPQTPQVQQRITSLRAEIQGVNIELRNAKQDLITWKSVFLDAARGIVSALAEVEEKMFAVWLVQKLLGFVRGGTNSGIADALFQISGDVAGGIHGATGGLVSGPGTSRSDSIPARLSDGEFVVQASAVSRVGAAFLHAINSLGDVASPPPIRGRLGFAGGGMVTGQSNDPGTSFHATLGLEAGLVLKHLDSPEGELTQLKFISRNAKKIRGLLGGG